MPGPTSTPPAYSSTRCSPATSRTRRTAPIQVAYKHVHEDIPAPSASTPGIPPYVDALVARATARDPPSARPTRACCSTRSAACAHALDHGVVDDQDLLDDLTPTTPVGGVRTPTGELPAQIIDPQDVVSPCREERRRLRPGARRPGAAARSSADADQQRQPVARHPQSPPRRSRRGPVLLTLVVVLAVLAALGGWYFGDRPLHHDPRRHEPHRGRRPGEAREGRARPEGEGPRLVRDRAQGPHPLDRPRAR